jgi:hypothetical protein
VQPYCYRSGRQSSVSSLISEEGALDMRTGNTVCALISHTTCFWFQYSMNRDSRIEASDKFMLGDFGDVKEGWLRARTVLLGASRLGWIPNLLSALKKEFRQDSARLH